MVKFIFKTLFKVPCIILVSYLIFNVFSFTVSYFRVLTVSQMALQTAIANNYIPPDEYVSLNNYMQDSLSSDILENVGFTSDTTFDKHQYGDEITVGITANYRFILPLMPREMTVDGFANTPSGSFKGWLSDSTLQAKRDANETDNNIVIKYKVPGLKYYPDLE